MKKNVRVSQKLDSENPEIYPLSETQKRFWTLESFESDKSLNLIVQNWTLKGPLDISLFYESVISSVLKHEALHTKFILLNGEVYQTYFVPKLQDLNSFFQDLSHLPMKNENTQNIINRFLSSNINLLSDEVFKIALLKIDSDHFVFLFVVHHIIADEKSMKIFSNDISLNYGILSQGDKIVTEKCKGYRQYLKDESDFLNSKRYKEIKNNLDDNKFRTSTLDLLPLKRIINSPIPYLSKTKKNWINIPLKKISIFSESLGSSSFTFLLTVYFLTIYRSTNKENVSIGVPVSQRIKKSYNDVFGLFVKPDSISLEIDPEKTFKDHLKTVQEKIYEALENGLTPLKQSNLQSRFREFSMSNLLWFVLEGEEGPTLKLDNIKCEGFVPDDDLTYYGIRMYIIPRAEQLLVRVDYAEDFFDEFLIDGVIERFENILFEVLDEPEQKVKEYSALLERDLIVFNAQNNKKNTKIHRNPEILERFLTKVYQHPHALALKSNYETLTYEQLNNQAEKLASKLTQNYQIGPSKVVALMANRNVHFFVGLLAAMKAKATFLPIDPNLPAQRLRFILADAQPSICLDGIEIKDVWESVTSHVLDDIAYIMYTSGSTGQPKGVKIKKSSLENYAEFILGENVLDNKKTNSILLSSLSSDLCYTSIFACLTTGGSLSIPSETELLDVLCIEKFLQEGFVNFCKLTPSYFRALSKECFVKTGQKFSMTLMFGGERLDGEIYAQIAPYVKKVINHYGPTEATIGCCVHICQQNDAYKSSVPIGNPISNTFLTILDNYKHLVPVGASGEIYISGKGISPGYINNSHLTKLQFQNITIDCGKKKFKQRFYKTGDIGRFLPDGSIEFLGRNDDQIKLRGYRIELEEIKIALENLIQVKQAEVVAVRNGSSNFRVVAFIIMKEDINDTFLNEKLKENLSEYMIPQVYKRLENYSLTPSGKIDRNKLEELALNDLNLTLHKNSQPQTKVEKDLAKLWSTIILKSNISREDDFFLIGGDSLKLITMLSELRKQGYTVSLADIIGHSKLFQLAHFLAFPKEDQDSTANNLSRISKRMRSKTVKRDSILSPMERWFFERSLKEPNHYVQVLKIRGAKSMSLEQLQVFFDSLIKKHDIFTRAYGIGEENHILKNSVEPKIYSLQIAGSTTEKYINDLIREMMRSIDIHKGPLSVCVLLENQNSLPLLIMVFHHLIMDYISLQVLATELKIFLNNKCENVNQLENPSSYSSWVKALHEMGLKGDLDYTFSYWETQTSNLTYLQKISEGSPSQFKPLARLFLTLDQENTEKISWLAQYLSVSLYSLILSSFGVVLQNVLITNTLGIVLEGHGRCAFNNLNDESVIGWLTTQFPFIISHQDMSKDAIKKVYGSIKDLPHHGVSYSILRYLLNEESLKYPENTIRLNYLGNINSPMKLDYFESFEIESVSSSKNAPPHALDIISYIDNGKLTFDLSFHLDYFSHKHIGQISKSLLDSLKILSLRDNPVNFVVPKEDNLDNSNHLIVLLHPIDGKIHWYKMMEEVFKSEGYKVLSISNTSVDDQYFDSIENIAKAYFKLVKNYGENKKVTLIGWSFGGILGFELAKYAKKVGEDFLVFIIDKPTSEDISNQHVCSPTVLFYRDLLKQHEIKGKVENIYFIKSSDLDNETNTHCGWEKNCNNLLTFVYNGDHYSFLNDHSIIKYVVDLVKWYNTSVS